MASLPPTRIHLFNSSGSPSIDVVELARYAQRLLGGAEVRHHGDFIAYCLGACDPSDVEWLKADLAEMLSEARVTDLVGKRDRTRQPQPVVEYERRMLDREPPRPVGVLYDGFDLCAAYDLLLSNAGISSDDLVVVITNLLFGTLEDDDGRYHARVIVFGSLCVVSTSGLVEAPARPRAYYLEERLRLTRPLEEEDTPEKWLWANDPRTTEVLKGYLAQAIFYHATGEPFCEERGCRLFNAHWQEDLLFSQLESESEFCEYHEKTVQTLSRRYA
jgi:hypothetical protein